MSTRETIYNRIRRKREECGYRQSDVAFMLEHKNSSQVSCYERGLIMPDSKNLMKLCYCLNTIPEGIYSEAARKWKKRVYKRKILLRKNKTKSNHYDL